MVFLCGICKEVLTISSSFSQKGLIKSIGCAHIFHIKCLNIFEVQLINGVLRSCPMCFNSRHEVQQTVFQQDHLRSRSLTSESSNASLSRSDNSTEVYEDPSHVKLRTISRNNSFNSISRRSYLRKKIVELHDSEVEFGIKRGSTILCFPDQPQVGIVKWIGKINQVLYFGIEFERSIGNNFPETNGASPFPCKISHGRLVELNDLILNKPPIQQPTPTPRKRLEKQSAIYAYDYSENQTSELSNEFSIHLKNFYEFCAKVNCLMQKIDSKVEESFSNMCPLDSNSVWLTLERSKSHLIELQEHQSLIQICNTKSEALFKFEELLLPSEERCIQRKIGELESLEASLKNKVEESLHFAETAQTILRLLSEQTKLISATKSHLRQMDQNLISTERELSDRVQSVEALLQSLQSHNVSEIDNKMSILSQKLPASENLTKLQNTCHDAITSEKDLIFEIEKKLETLKEANEDFCSFTSAVEEFNKWYEDYSLKLFEAEITETQNLNNNDFSSQSLIEERAEKRKQFLQILRSARKLRVSIFDPSVLDYKIQSLQMRWRQLMEQLYRDRGRKTV